jgi:MFS family permease
MQRHIGAAGGQEIDSTYSWVRLALSVLIGTVGSVGMWAIVVVLPAVQAEFGGDRGGTSLAYTMTMLGFAAGNVFFGRIVDRYGITLPLIVAALSLGAGFGFSAMATSIVTFALLHFLIGLGASASFGPLIADVSHWFVRRRGIAVAAAATGNYLAGAIWPLAMQPFLASQGWRFTFVGIALICMAVIIPLSFVLRRRVSHEGTAAAAAAAARTARASGLSAGQLQALLIVAGLGCCVAMSMPQVHIVAYCVDLGYGVARGAEMLSLMLVGGIVSRLVSGVLADRIGGVPTLLIGSLLQCVALVLYIPFDGLASLYVVSLVFGLSQGGIVPSYAIIVREYLPAHEAGQRVGIVIMSTILGMAIGGWMSGWIYDMTGSYQAAFLNGIVWNLLNIAIMALILLRTRPARPVAA